MNIFFSFKNYYLPKSNMLIAKFLPRNTALVYILLYIVKQLQKLKFLKQLFIENKHVGCKM